MAVSNEADLEGPKESVNLCSKPLAIAALADEPVDVVLTTGYQELPEEFKVLPQNFRHAAYVPGPLMAERCDLIVFHGGHSSVMTTLKAGTPAVIIPTIRERESNARRLASLGAGEVVMPVNGADGEKLVDVAEFGMNVKRVLNEPSYVNPPSESPNPCVASAVPGLPQSVSKRACSLKE
jgi:hypothetical protein